MVINVRGVAYHIFDKLSPILVENLSPTISPYFFQLNSFINLYGISVKMLSNSSSNAVNILKVGFWGSVLKCKDKNSRKCFFPIFMKFEIKDIQQPQYHFYSKKVFLV